MAKFSIVLNADPITETAVDTYISDLDTSRFGNRINYLEFMIMLNSTVLQYQKDRLLHILVTDMHKVEDSIYNFDLSFETPMQEYGKSRILSMHNSFLSSIATHDATIPELKEYAELLLRLNERNIQLFQDRNK